MGKRIKWSTDFKRYPERRWRYKGLKGMGKEIIQVLLVLCALYAIYAFFYKKGLNSERIKSSAAEIKPAEAGVLDPLGELSVEDGLQDEGSEYQ